MARRIGKAAVLVAVAPAVAALLYMLVLAVLWSLA